MFETLEVFRMADAMTRHAGVRQNVMAGNTANADTPGYKARDVVPFADLVEGGAPAGVVQMLREVPGVYKTVGPEFESQTQIGMAVAKGNTAMSDALQGALKEIVADGTYKQIIEKWKFPASVSLFD